MDLTVGANQFFWPDDRWAGFYEDLAGAPVDRIVLGELVCSKRLPFYQNRLPEAIATLLAAGKDVVVTSLALITLKRERKMTSELAEMGMEVEINDLTVLAHLPDKTRFSVGPLVNVYNEGTLKWLAARGATRICLPPELPLASVETLTATAADLGVAIEVWGHGRLPLAISGRCYHARLHNRSKDNCQFACEEDPDGLEIRTLGEQSFLAMNGVQTLSDTYACSVYHAEALENAGVTALRLSPQSTGFHDLCRLYRQLLDREQTASQTADAIGRMDRNIRLSDGFLTGDRGADWSGSQQPEALWR